VPLELPEEIDTSGDLEMAASPDGRLVVTAPDACRKAVHILDNFSRPRQKAVHVLDMRVLHTVACECLPSTTPTTSHLRAARTQAPGCAGRAPWTDPRLADSDDSIFYCSWQKTAQSTLLSRRSSHDGTIEAEYRLEGYGLSVSERGGLLFCVIWVVDGADDGTTDEIIALDAQTLELCHRFGLGLFDGALWCTAAGCGWGRAVRLRHLWNDRLQVFFLTGEHRRSITGEWRLPRRLCCAKDRLYLVEGGHDSISVQGHWILVLSLQGDILQVVTHPTEPKVVFRSICCFDGKLLASYCTLLRRYHADGRHHRMLALRGL